MAEKEEKSAETKEAEGAAGAEAESPPAKSGKKKKIIILAAALLVIGGLAGAFFAGVLPFGKGGGAQEEASGGHGGDDGHGKKSEKKGEHGEADPATQLVYLDMDEFLVNLNTGGRQVSFLKMKVTLEIQGVAAKAEVEAKMPRIRDSFQVYLRELRASDLQGAAGLHRLREELLLRINKVVYPSKVTDILFKEIVVQ